MYTRFLRWIDKAKFSTVRKKLINALGSLAIILAVMSPQFLFGALYGIVTWSDYRVPVVILALFSFHYGSSVIRAYKSLRARNARKGNQHTYHGIPVDEMVSYLLEQKSFTRDHAISSLHISREKYDAIAGELESHGVLHRGENNARVLAPIDRWQLIMQLQSNFPLEFDEQRGMWSERDGSFSQWILNREKKDQREQYKRDRGIERLEKKRDTLKQEIADMQDVGFISRAVEIS